MQDARAAAGAVGTASITDVSVGESGIAVGAEGEYAPGIGRVGFVLLDLSQRAPANVVELTDVQYPLPLPEHAGANWTSSAALVSGVAYRLFFHVYDRTGVNLVAYDRRDFVWQSHGTQEE